MEPDKMMYLSEATAPSNSNVLGQMMNQINPQELQPKEEPASKAIPPSKLNLLGRLLGMMFAEDPKMLQQFQKSIAEKKTKAKGNKAIPGYSKMRINPILSSQGDLRPGSGSGRY